VAASTSQARMGIKRGKGSAPAVHATEKAGERLQSKVSSPIFFFYFTIFNYYFRNEPDETFFFNLALLSRVNPSIQGAGACPVATLVEMVTRRISRTN
jgi:hypothetical protein